MMPQSCEIYIYSGRRLSTKFLKRITDIFKYSLYFRLLGHIQEYSVSICSLENGLISRNISFKSTPFSFVEPPSDTLLPVKMFHQGLSPLTLDVIHIEIVWVFICETWPNMPDLSVIEKSFKFLGYFQKCCRLEHMHTSRVVNLFK